MSAEQGKLYFIKDKYFQDFPDDKLMKNKEMINGVLHDRPCYYSFCDLSTGLDWFVPISSKVAKYKIIYDKLVKKSKRGICDSIVFGYILGEERAFLLQNMCPVIDDYISGVYIDMAINNPVKIKDSKKAELDSKAEKILTLYRKGIPVILPDVNKIELTLVEIIESIKETALYKQ